LNISDVYHKYEDAKQQQAQMLELMHLHSSVYDVKDSYRHSVNITAHNKCKNAPNMKKKLHVFFFFASGPCVISILVLKIYNIVLKILRCYWQKLFIISKQKK